MIQKALLTVIALLLLGAGAYGVWSYQRMSARVESLEHTASELDDLTKRFDAFQKEVAYRRDFDTVIRSNRSVLTLALEKASYEDPATAGFLTTRLPDGLREAYEKARAERLALPDRH